MKKPTVSVIMSVRNGQNYLSDAIKSILIQTYKNFEFIIVNDASQDKTPKILKSFKDPRIKIITNSHHLGLTKSLNIGLKISKGQFIARMDADDISKPERLKTQLKFLLDNPKVAGVGSWVEFIDEKGQKIKTKKLPETWQDIKRNLIKANQLYHPTLMIRKEILNKLGGYNEFFEYSQDYELNLRIAGKFSLANIPKTLLLYRVNTKGTISIDNVKKQAWYALLARLKAIREYGYPKWQIIYLVKPLISFIIPKPIILWFYKNLFFRKSVYLK